MALRGMFDYAFFMMDNNYASRERIRTQFGGVFPSMEVFESVFFACTTLHKAMVIDLRATSYKLEDCVFWYKAEDHGFFKVGVADVWDRGIEEDNKKKKGKETKKNFPGSDRVRMEIKLEGYVEEQQQPQPAPSATAAMASALALQKKKKKKTTKPKPKLRLARPPPNDEPKKRSR